MTALSESKSITNVGVITDPKFPLRNFSKRINRILKNCLCFIHYRLLMLYRILLNFCIWQEDIVQYLTALSDSKSFQKCTFFYTYFIRELMIFKTCSCCIHYGFLTLYRILPNFRIWKDHMMHYLTALTEKKLVQKCRGYYRA